MVNGIDTRPGVAIFLTLRTKNYLFFFFFEGDIKLWKGVHTFYAVRRNWGTHYDHSAIYRSITIVQFYL